MDPDRPNGNKNHHAARVKITPSFMLTNQSPSDWIPVLSLIVAAVAVFVGPFVTLHVGRKQIELSRRIASRQIVAPMRQAWINALRDKLAELSNSALLYWNTEFDRRAEEEQHRLFLIEEQIKLLINPDEPDHKELVAAIKNLLWALQKGVLKDSGNDFSLARERVLLLGQKILKTEWNRVKNDIEKP